MSSPITAQSTLYRTLLQRQTAADINRQLDTASEELSTGVHADIFATLGAGSAEGLGLRASIQLDEAQMQANRMLQSRLEATASALTSIRDSAAGVLDLSVANASAAPGTEEGLQLSARTALNALMSQVNVTYGSAPLFAGTASTSDALQPWEEANDSGLAPAAALAQITGGQLTDLADAEAKIAALGAAFADSAADSALNYSETFYNGAGEADRLQGYLGDGAVMRYGVQANDQAFRDVVQGLAMLSSVDPAGIEDPAAYEAWMAEANTRLSTGLAGLLDAETTLGAQAAQLEARNDQLDARLQVYNSRILDLEGVDSYEAATRVTFLENQLQASYAVTSSLSKLSFLNFM